MLHIFTCVNGRHLRASCHRAVFCLAFLVLAMSAFGQNPQVPQGGNNTFPSTGTGMPVNPQWDITWNGGIIATSQSPGGWSVSYSASKFTVGAPATAPPQTAYCVRYEIPGQPPQPPSGVSALFDVVSSGGGTWNLTATVQGATVVLNWTATPTTGETFVVKRGSTTTGPYPYQVGTSSTTTLTDTNLPTGSNCFYIVYATFTGGTQSANSNEASVTLVPLAPSLIGVVPGNGQISLRWSAPTGNATPFTYSLYRGTASGAENPQPIATLNGTTSYLDAGLTNGTAYYYVVTASDAAGPSAISSEGSAVPGTAPNAPVFKTVVAGNGQVVLAWTAPAGAQTYDVYRGASTGNYTSHPVVASSTTSYRDTGLTNGVTYYYVVTASNGYGTSGHSPEIHATPALSFWPINAIPNQFGYLDVPMTLPGWMEGVEPIDAGQGDGPSGAISVNLAFGDLRFDSGPDLALANMAGAGITFEREYRTVMANAGLSSKGLPPGWTHNWDYWMVSTTPGTWGPIQLVYPNGSSETLTPNLDAGGNPLGTFNTAAGAPYTATGSASTSAGVWNQIALVHNGLSQEIFTIPAGDTVYRPLTVIQANNSQLNFHYDSSSRLTSIDNASSTNSLSMQLNLTYSGSLLSEAKDNYGGNARYYTYTSGLLSTVSTLVDTSVEWTYAYTAMSTPAGWVNYLYTATSRDPQGNWTTTTLGYDGISGVALTRSDPTNNIRTTSYPSPFTGAVNITNSQSGQQTDSFTKASDTLGRTISQTSWALDTTLFSYGSSNLALPTLITLPNHTSVNVSADSNGNPTQVAYPYGNSTLYSWSYPSYAPQGLLSSVTERGRDGTLATTAYTYFTTTQPSSGQFAGSLQKVTYPNNDVLTYSYTSHGDVLAVSDSTGATTTYDYSSGGSELAGRPYSVMDPAGWSTSFQYDPRGRLIGAVDPMLNQASQTYNGDNQIASITLPEAMSVQFNYLASGRPPTGSVLYQSSSPVRDETYYYDSQSQPASSIDGNGLSTMFTLDGESDLTGLVNGNGLQVHSFLFAPWVREEVTTLGVPSSPNALTLTTTLTSTGNVLTVAGSDNRTETNYYQTTGDLDLLVDTKVQDPTIHSMGGTAMQWMSETAFQSYDGFERLTDVRQYTPDLVSWIEHQYAYDNEGNVLTDNFSAIANLTPNGDGLLTLSDGGTQISYAYNPDGTRRQMVIQLQSVPGGPAAVTYNYTYDPCKRVTSIYVYPGNSVSGGTPLAYANYSYDKNGRVTAVRSMKATTLYSYDGLGRVTQIQNLSPDSGYDHAAPTSSQVPDPYVAGVTHTVFQQFGSTYDGKGDRASMSFVALTYMGTNPTTDPSTYASGAANWSYDSGSRLTGESWTSPTSSSVSFNHAYDGAGNLTSLRGNTFTVDKNTDRLTSGGYSSLTYNSSGELTAFGSSTIGYDPLGELTTYSGGTSSTYSASVVYDHLGRRAVITETMGPGTPGPAGTPTTDSQFFVYDGGDLVYRLFSKLTPLDQPDFTNFVDSGMLYLYGPTGLVMEFDSLGANAKTFLFDPNGNTVSMSNGIDGGTDFKGSTAVPMFYDAYGLPVWTPPTPNAYPAVLNRATSQPFQYKGQYGYYTDGATGLIYCIHRYYDPNTGRWTERDPTGLDGGANVYAYCDGDPVGNVDSDGLVPDWDYFAGWHYKRKWGAWPKTYLYEDYRGSIVYHFADRGPDRPLDHWSNRDLWIPTVVGGVLRKPKAVLIQQWEDLNAMKWPINPANGRPYIAHHVQALADGGPDEASNVQPVRTMKDHVEIHKAAGDQVRWAKEAWARRRRAREIEKAAESEQGHD